MKNKAGRPKTGVNTTRIHVALNRSYDRERNALEVFDALLNGNDGESPNNTCWSKRRIIAEALVALGEKMDDNWQPDILPNMLQVPSSTLALVKEMSNTMQDVQAFMDNFQRGEFAVSTQSANAATEFDNLQTRVLETNEKLGADTMFGDGAMFDDAEDY